VSVVFARGFRAAGVAAGIKSAGTPDVALVVNDGPTQAAAAVFTTNRVKAAPVLWSQQVLRTTGAVRAVVLNSGGANACTGPQGFQDTHRTAEHVAAGLGIGAIDVAVCSTGLIGVRLPMERLLAGIDDAVMRLATDAKAGADAATAIMTTDSINKQAHLEHDSGFRVGGMAKGAGMLAPSLATMLVVLTTDAHVDAAMLDDVLREACAETFERIDSDGCMSTNDTVLLLASGLSAVAPTRETLVDAVRAVCVDLARQLISDAEGATKEISIEVTGGLTVGDAVEVGRVIARNNLVKCAIHGEDPNWGRILAAVGTADADFDPDAIGVSINGVTVCRDGAAVLDVGSVDMSQREVRITVDLGAGAQSATIWTNDLSALYVHENSAYST
jgi:glutamate N-acetyltransferase / amino-acid N-acetyltransferase